MTRFLPAALLALATSGAAILPSVSLAQTGAQTVSVAPSALATAPGRLVVDIREPDEWRETGVLPGVQLHSWRDPESFARAFAAELAAGDDIYLICRSGNRSYRAAEALSAALGRPVIDVAGGMIEVAGKGHVPLVAPSPAAGCTVC